METNKDNAKYIDKILFDSVDEYLDFFTAQVNILALTVQKALAKQNDLTIEEKASLEFAFNQLDMLQTVIRDFVLNYSGNFDKQITEKALVLQDLLDDLQELYSHIDLYNQNSFKSAMRQMMK